MYTYYLYVLTFDFDSALSRAVFSLAQRCPAQCSVLLSAVLVSVQRCVQHRLRVVSHTQKYISSRILEIL